MIDIDLALKRTFDERLRGFVPPARSPRPSRSTRVLIGAGVATLVFAGAGLAIYVESVAAANGGCADVFAKIKIWTATKVNTDMTPLEIKAVISKIARDAGCLDTKVVDPTQPKNANPKLDSAPQLKPAGK